MNDTAPHVQSLVDRHHAAMTPEARLRAASAMFDAARLIVRSTLDPQLSPPDRRLAELRRLYGESLPDAAKMAFAAGASSGEQPVVDTSPI